MVVWFTYPVLQVGRPSYALKTALRRAGSTG